MITINELTGIKYSHGKHDLKKTDCFGLVHLYYKHILRSNAFPFNDGKKISRFRNKNKDLERTEKGMAGIGFKEINVKRYEPGDVFIIAGKKNNKKYYACIAVAINDKELLLTVGDGSSHIRKIDRLKKSTHKVYRRSI